MRNGPEIELLYVGDNYENIRHRSILLGLALVCASPFVASTTPASAAPHLMDQRGIGEVRTLEGTVSKDLKGSDFELRTKRGRTVRVYVKGGEPGNLSRGDRVRVTGRYNDRKDSFIARSATVIRDH